MSDEQTRVLRQLHDVLCRFMATMRMYWPNEDDAGAPAIQGEVLRFGPFTAGQIVGLFTSAPVQAIARVSQLDAGINSTAVPASAPTYQMGVHVYVIRPGPVKYLYVVPTTAAGATVGLIRGDTDTHVR